MKNNHSFGRTKFSTTLNYSKQRYAINASIGGLFMLLVFSIIFVGLGCDPDDEVDPPVKDMDMPIDEMDTTVQTFMSSFKLLGDGYDEVISYISEDNLMFCKLSGNDMWIRLARDRTWNGENGPHIDIDICNYDGAGDYSPVDPHNRPCPVGLLWDIWWHDGDRIYANQETSSPCQLSLTLDGEILSGVFNCSDVLRFEGSEIMEITQGAFSCKIE